MAESKSEDESVEDQQKVVLYEDKEYYPQLGEAYPEAEVMIEEEDTMDIDQPILPPPKKQKYNYTTKTHLEGKFLVLWIGSYFININYFNFLELY